MTIEETYLHTCRIRKDVDDATEDDLGLPDRTRTLVSSAVECRFVVNERKLFDDERAESAVAEVYKLFVKESQEIEENYIIDTIVLEDGSTVPESYKVHKVFRRFTGSGHHKKAILERLP